MTMPIPTMVRSGTPQSGPGHASIIGCAIGKLARRIDQDIDAVRSDSNPGAIHDLRVDLVKLMTILRGCPARADIEPGPALPEELRWLKAHSTDVRDWDVLLGDCKIWNSTGHGDKALHELLSLARISRRKAADSIAAAVRTERCALLQEKLYRLANSHAPSMEGNDSEAEHDLVGMLEHAFRAVRKRAHACDTLDPDDLHSLRKAVKRLRYTCEMLWEGFGGRADNLVLQAHSLQRALGTIHDAEVGRSRIKRLVKGRDKYLRHRAKGLCNILKSRQRGRKKQIGLEWERFHQTKRFWAHCSHDYQSVKKSAHPALPN